MKKQEKSNKKKKVILISAGVLGAALLSYLGYKVYKKSKTSAKAELPPVSTSNLITSSSSSSTSTSTSTKSSLSSDNFPLGKGSKGTNVFKLQLALINKFGSKVLPKYGADGMFGSETENALVNNGYPKSVSRSVFDTIVSGNIPNPKALAKTFFDAITSDNFTQAIYSLRGMNTTKDYSDVSSALQVYRFNGVRKTLVNALFDRFNSSAEKSAIGKEFTRMGLKFDGSKWSLSGIPICRVKSRRPAKVQKIKTSEWFDVTHRIVLGRFQNKDKDYYYFLPRDSKETYRISRNDADLLH